MNIPEWLSNLFPDELKSLVKGAIPSAPSHPGRKSSIDADSVNDIAYYLTKGPTLFNNEDPMKELIKGTNLNPSEYCEKRRSYKCLVYLACHHHSLSYLCNPFSYSSDEDQDFSNVPSWYIYFYLFASNCCDIKPDCIYDVVMNSPVPVQLFQRIINKLSDKTHLYDNRQNINQEKDIEFYKSLPKTDKFQIIRLMEQHQIKLGIHYYLFEEGHLNYIFRINGCYKLFEYCVKTNKIAECKAFFDKHRKLFSHIDNHVRGIMPQFRELYPFAFEQSRFRYSSTIHLKRLIEYGFYNEVQFFVSKRYQFEDDELELCMKAGDKMFSILSPKLQTRAIDYAMAFAPSLFHEYYSKGFRPTIEGPFQVIKFNKVYDGDLFSVIKYLPDDLPLDRLKEAVAFHPEYIQNFIKRYGHRFQDPSPKSWNLSVLKKWGPYARVCDILGFDKSLFTSELLHACFKESMPLNRSTILNCLDYHTGDLNPKYLRTAIREDDLKIAAKLVRAGANPEDVSNWRKKCSPEMYRTIMKNL